MPLLQHFSITSKTLTNKYIIATLEDTVKDLVKEEADTFSVNISRTLRNSELHKYTSLRLTAEF